MGVLPARKQSDFSPVSAADEAANALAYGRSEDIPGFIAWADPGRAEIPEPPLANGWSCSWVGALRRFITNSG